MVSTFIQKIKSILAYPLGWWQKYISSEQYIEVRVGPLVKILLLVMFLLILIFGMTLTSNFTASIGA